MYADGFKFGLPTRRDRVGAHELRAEGLLVRRTKEGGRDGEGETIGEAHRQKAKSISRGIPKREGEVNRKTVFDFGGAFA